MDRFLFFLFSIALCHISGIAAVEQINEGITLIVNTDSDSGDDVTIATSLEDDQTDGNGLSIREALHWAVEGDVITFDLLPEEKIILTSQLQVTKEGITIDGDLNDDGRPDVTISGNNNFRIFNTNPQLAEIKLIGLIITEGRGNGGGGAIAIGSNSFMEIRNCHVINNQEFGWGGGGIYGSSVTLTVINSIVSHNSSDSFGGGIRLVGNGILNLINSTVSNNSTIGSGAHGAGIQYAGPGLLIVNSTISGNAASGSSSIGGGLRISSGAAAVYNSTIVGNSASDSAGGVSANGANDVFFNSVIAGNTSGAGAIAGENGSPLAGGGFADDVQGYLEIGHNNYFGSNVNIISGSENLNNQDTQNLLLGNLENNGGYVLTHKPLEGSALINSGNNDYAPDDTFDLNNNGNTGEPLPVDGAMNPRISESTVEIGAVEKIGISPDTNNILYVNQNVSGGTQMGNSWANAVPELADALKWAKQNESQWTAENPLQIWVAEGTYIPMYSPDDDNFGNPDGRQNTFLIVKDVLLYGGFSGVESNLSERNWNENPTILSAEIQNDGERTNNAYHVMAAGGDLGSAIIDGFIIQDGRPINDVGESQFTANGFIFQNRAGGGIIAIQANLIVNNSVFRDNNGYGGVVISNFLGATNVSNSLFYNNSSNSGSIITSDSVKLVNVTVSKNVATRVIYSEQLNIANSILWGNDLYEDLLHNQVDIQNSIIENYDESPDPLFTDLANGDFTLTRNSPAINTGNNSLYEGLNENIRDIAGNSRLFGMNIDMGAYEFQSEVISPNENNILYVNKNVSGGNQRGNSWENAIPELADALKWAKQNESNWTAENPLQIWVAEGTYIPMYSPADNNFGNPDGRQNSFLVVKDVLLYGGFSGVESNLNARNWNENPTILSGEIQNDGEKNNNNYHVMTAAGDMGSAIIDGFIVQDGCPIIDSGQSQFTANGFSFQNRVGGGIIAMHTHLILNNSVFRNNNGYGGIAIENDYGTTTVTNSSFYDNLVRSHGYLIGSNTLKLVNVTISKNTATYLIYSDQLNIMNSVLWGNDLNFNLYYNHINVENSIIENYDESPDPLFTDAGNGDFSLQACSPAVNMGNNSLFEGLNENTVDLVGNPRLFGTNIDMGAYEFQDEQVDYSQVTFEDLTVTYNGISHSIEVENLPEGISVSYEITNENNTTSTGNSATDAGIYQIKATLSGCGQPQEFNATLTIEKAEAIITADATQTKTYNGTLQIVTASLNHVETALNYAPQQGYTNAGTYQIMVSASETDNYLEVSKQITLIIENADWNPGGGGSDIHLPDETYTYNANPQSVEVENLPLSATVTYTITDSENNTETGNSATNAGSYTVTALVQMANYNDLELTAELIINKAEAIIAANDVQMHVYDGTVKNALASLNHSETSLVYTPQQGYTDAGTYPITISAVETQNYSSSSKEIDLIIENADFEGIEFEDGEFTYDGIAHSIFVSNAPENATVTYTNNGQTNAGAYIVSALIQMPNYNDLTLTAELIINKAEAIINSESIQTHVYDGTVKNAVASLNHNETTLQFTPQQGYANAGTYPISISAVETQNYLSVSKMIDLVIENAEFDGIEFEDSEFTYDGIAHSIFVSNAPENAIVTYTNNGQINAGTYTVSALIQMANYNDLTLTAELIINKAEAIIIANDVQTHIYDGDLKNAVASLNHSETTLVYTPEQGYTNAGTYPITISAVETQNYLAVSKSIDLVIENAEFDGIEFEDAEFTYDGIAHSIFVSNAPENATVTYTNNGQINAGSYTVSALIQMSNYNDLTLTAELIINKAEAVITANDVQMHVYDGTIKNTVASLNHAETTLVYAPQQGYTEAGTYPITISAEETQNYLSASKEINLIIENADFDGIEFEDGEFTYGGIAHSIFVSNAPENATVTYTNNEQTNAGIYIVSALIQMPNYNDLELEAELIINKADQFITFNPIPVKHLENDDDFQLDALASSELDVYYTYTFDTENPAATVTPSGWVELLTSGSIWITAHQYGNENYNAAVSVERELEILSSNNSIISINIHGETFENPPSEIYYLMDCDDSSTSINIEIETETGATVVPGHNFSIEVPKPGIYYQTVTVTSQNGIARTYEIIIEKRFNFNDIVIQKFDNVLLVNNNFDNNGGYEFNAYEWYKNGALIGTGQYYSAGDNSTDTLDPNAVYHVRMRTTDGEWLSTCESGIELRVAYSVKIAPNPAKSGNVIKVIADFPEDELKDMKIKLFSMAGELILETNSSERVTEIRLPAGMTSASYVIQVNTGKTVKNIQFLVK